jgi:putative membrane protein
VAVAAASLSAPVADHSINEGENTMLTMTVFGSTILYAVLGIAIFVIGFRLWDWLTPVDIWKEIAEKHNIALAVMAGAIAIALAIIIGSAIHG